MSESKSREPVIAVGVDGSEQSLAAVRWAAGEAARREVGLELVHALGIPSLYMGPWEPSAEVRDALTKQAEELLAAAVTVARDTADVPVHTRIDNDDPAAALVGASRSGQLVALGATGRGGFLSGLGSAAVQVSAHAHAPVVVVRGELSAIAADAPIVAGVDGSPESDAALGTVSGRKFTADATGQVYELRVTVTVRPRDERQMLVRANAEFNNKPVEDPAAYQNFFNALGRSIFLVANRAD